MRSFWSLVFCLFSLSALAAGNKVEEFMLGNGMKVIVKPDHRAPVVVSQVWYKVGSSYEQPGTTGVSHVLEHMMFKGTRHVAPDEFSRIIAALGGSENAFTGIDYTAYFETLSRQHLERALELEADRMQNLLLDEKEFQREVAVVREERRLRTDDDPNGLLWEQFNAVAWRVSPYRNPVIGWMHDLEVMSVADLRQWYERWYSPDNAILVVVGDVAPVQVLALAKKHFGAIPARQHPPWRQRPEPEQKGPVRMSLQIPAEQPVLLMGYKAPAMADLKDPTEAYALMVLNSILGDGDSSRLSAAVVREQGLAVSASSSYDAFSRLSGLLEVQAIPARDVNLDDLESGLLSQIRRLQQEPVSKQELQRVINRTLASKVFARDSMFYQAMLMGMRETNGYDWHSLDEELKHIRAVTPRQVQAVARKYLVEEHLTVARLEPVREAAPVAREKKS
ncbi:M16 family metallopeptidase [Thiolapillus brandeum]|uniref:Peptidase M16 family protein n=1 Tax=Thiolapillus brandeum TaxID=1076588 RepID=A0A7U6GJT9_9GAMM|nr:pitrilysin family protein [Thiolapillus brandeum]BAO44957.1 peptidase M16 family protein [Thiolapillus brandeum]